MRRLMVDREEDWLYRGVTADNVLLFMKLFGWMAGRSEVWIGMEWDQ